VGDQPPVYRFIIRWPVGHEDLPGIAARLVRELRGRAPGLLVCNLAAAPAAGTIDAVAVDAVARLALTARRCRWTVRLDSVPAELAGLIAMMGLTSVLLPGEPTAPGPRQP
jgi:hypothetical protein